MVILMPTNVILLAAQRPGITDPLAIAHNVSHKCIIPIGGKPLIMHVLETLAHHPAVGDIGISIERDGFAALAPVIAALGDAGTQIRCIPSQLSIADSVIAAITEMGDRPTMITTADNALLTAVAIQEMANVLSSGADVAVGLTTKPAVLSTHPQGQNRFYTFSDNHYSNCNLYGLSGAHALAAAEIFRGGGQFAKKIGRIIESFGVLNLLLLRSGMISLDGAMRRISKRIGLRVRPVVLTEGRNAIDVDNERTYQVVAKLLKQDARHAGSLAWPELDRLQSVRL
tara:strand:+ start:26944 stop:27798 length:855 start_codon:yes stop_codon:yes gene_type:complete